MTVFQGAVDAAFAAFGIDAIYTPAGEPVSVRVIARRPDTSSPSARGLHHPGRAGAARSRPAGVEPRRAAGVSPLQVCLQTKPMFGTPVRDNLVRCICRRNNRSLPS
jgi:hypothetical protein